MSKIKHQDESSCSKYEMTYLVVHVKDDLQAELNAIEQVEPKYRPTKDQIVKKWESDSELGTGYLAKHYLLKPPGAQWEESYKKLRITELADCFLWVVNNPKLQKLLPLTFYCETNIGKWLAIVRDKEETEKLVYTPNQPGRIAEDGEPYYSIIHSVFSSSSNTKQKLEKMLSPEKI